MSADDRLDDVKAIVQEWLDKQGHDRCWWYPELFERLAEVLELKATVPARLPPRCEFEAGCRRFTDSQYGS